MGWRTATINSTTIKQLTGGLTNSVWEVCSPQASPERVVVRYFGEQAYPAIDRAREAVILECLNSKNLGPRVLATFEGGRIEAVVPGQALRFTQLREPDISQAVARALKTFHSITAPSLQRTADVFETLACWIDQLAHCPDWSATTKHPTQRGFPRQSKPPLSKIHHTALTQVITNLKGNLLALSAERVLSHNDLVAGNIISNQDEYGNPHCTLIDVEYSSWGPRGFDLANLFRDWQGYGGMPYPPPCKAEKSLFIQIYLQSTPEEEASTQAIQALMQETTACQPISDIYWMLWSTLRAYEANISGGATCDYGRYAQYRFGLLPGKITASWPS